MRVIQQNNIKFKISYASLNTLSKFIQDDDQKNESGGILIGYTLGNNVYSITNVSLPCSEDKASRFRFLRSKKKAQRIINQFFKESKGKKIYLGEWHTHPENYPTPSMIDKCSIKKQFKKNELNSDRIFMLIIGRKSFHLSSVDENGIMPFVGKYNL